MPKKATVYIGKRELSSKLNQLLSDSKILDSSIGLRRLMRSGGGVQASAKLIERLADIRRPVSTCVAPLLYNSAHSSLDSLTAPLLSQSTEPTLGKNSLIKTFAVTKPDIEINSTTNRTVDKACLIAVFFNLQAPRLKEI